MFQPLTYEQAAGFSAHEYIWRARLRSGQVIWEQPGVSSDHLPADQTVGLDYVPCRRPDLPTIESHVDLDRGERFVRYWTNIWAPNGRGSMRLYVVGVCWSGRYALVCHYPRYNRIIFAATRPFEPPWIPEPFGLLPSDAVSVGGPGTPRYGWHHEGFGGLVMVQPGNRIEFRSLHA